MTTESQTRTYTTRGSVCGGCDHKHQSIRTALECIGRHHDAIARGNTHGAYSDRCVVRSDGSPLDDDELDELHYLYELAEYA